LAELIDERLEQKQQQTKWDARRREWEADPEAYKVKYNESYAAQKREKDESIRRKEIDDRMDAKYSENLKLTDLELEKARIHAQRVEQALAYQDEIDKKSDHAVWYEQEMAEIKASRAKREELAKQKEHPVSMPRPATTVKMTLWGQEVNAPQKISQVRQEQHLASPYYIRVNRFFLRKLEFFVRFFAVKCYNILVRNTGNRESRGLITARQGILDPGYTGLLFGRVATKA